MLDTLCCYSPIGLTRPRFAPDSRCPPARFVDTRGGLSDTCSRSRPTASRRPAPTDRRRRRAERVRTTARARNTAVVRFDMSSTLPQFVVDIKFYLLHWRRGLETHASTSSRSQGQASRHDRPPSDGCPTRGAREPVQAGDCPIAAGGGDAVGKALCVARATAVARGRRRYCGPGRRSSGRGAVD